MGSRLIRIRNGVTSARRRPVMMAIAGDSASGKTTVAAGLVEALGPHRCLLLSTDDYHRFDRAERLHKPFTALHPDSNYIEILGQHLQLLATGQPVLKPVYDHSSGQLVRPQLVEPPDFVIVEGLLPLHSRLARACFHVTVFLDPAESVRRDWKILRDTTSRNYSTEEVLAELAQRSADSAAYIRPQQAHADVVVRFAPIDGRDDPPGTPMSATLVLRPTIRQPDLAGILPPGIARTMHMRLANDDNGRPVDSVHVHGYADADENARVEKFLWHALAEGSAEVPESLGRINGCTRSTPLAVTQMLLLYHLLHSNT